MCLTHALGAAQRHAAGIVPVHSRDSRRTLLCGKYWHQLSAARARHLSEYTRGALGTLPTALQCLLESS